MTYHRIKLKQWTVALLISVTLILSMTWLSPVEATSAPTIPGRFESEGFRAPPTVENLQLFRGLPTDETYTELTQNGSLTPQVDHFVRFDVVVVNPQNSFEGQWFNLSGAGLQTGNSQQEDASADFITRSSIEVFFKIFYSDSFGAQYTPSAVTGNAVATLEDEFNSLTATHPDGLVGRVILTRNLEDNTFDFEYELLTTVGVEQTWDIMKEFSNVSFSAVSTEPGISLEDGAITQVRATFELAFKPSKTSLESLTTEQNWVVAASAVDVRGPEVSDIESSIKHGMQWYGEVTVPEDARIDWGNIDVQDLANSDTDYLRTTIAEPHVKFVSNGPYQHTFSGDTQWQGTQPGNVAILVTNPALNHTLSDQEFMIRINQEIVVQPRFDLLSLQLQAPGFNDQDDFAPARRGLDYVLSRSAEAGRFTDFSLFLRLGPTFQNDIYSGNIQIGIRPLLNDLRLLVDTQTVRNISEGALPLSSAEDFLSLGQNNTVVLDNPNDNPSVWGQPTLLSLAQPLNEAGSVIRYVVVGEGPYRNVFKITDLNEQNFVLTGDIDFSGVTNHTPIGTPTHPFTGNFIGQGFEIKNLTVDAGTGLGGLFGYAQGGTFKDVFITNASIEGGTVGVLMARGQNVTIENVEVHGTVRANAQSQTMALHAGGVAGELSGTSEVKVSVNRALVEIVAHQIGAHAGGIAGELKNNSTIQQSINYGHVRALSSTGSVYLGGITNTVASTTSVLDNLNLGQVGFGTLSGSSYFAGGIVGQAGSANLRRNLQLGTFENPSAARFGEIGGTASGYANHASNYFRSANNSGLLAYATAGTQPSVAQGRGYDDRDLRRVSAFVGWDFENTWGINNLNEAFNNTFPFPLWQVERDGFAVFDIRADVLPPTAGLNALSGTQNFVVNAGVGPNHSTESITSWHLELKVKPVDFLTDDVLPLTTTGITSGALNSVSNRLQTLNTLNFLNEPFEYQWHLTVIDSDGNERQTVVPFDIVNPTANGQVAVLQESDTQIIVNFDQRTLLREGTTLNSNDFDLIVYGFNKTITEPVPDPTVANFSDAARGLRPRNITHLIESAEIRESDGSAFDPNGSGNTQLVLTLSEPFQQDPANNAVGEYFRLEFLRRAQVNLINPGGNPLRTQFTRDLVRPLMIRVADFTSGGMSGTSGWFPRGYTFSVTEPIKVTSIIGGMNGSANNVLLGIWETQNSGSSTIPANSPGTRIQPVDINSPLVWIRTSGSGSVSQIEFAANAILVPNKTYLLLQMSFDGNSTVSHHRASGDIDFQQIENFNTRIFNWGPNNGLNWRFTQGGFNNIPLSNTQSENTRPALGFRYVVPTEAELNSAGITFSNGAWSGNPVADIRRENSDWTQLVVND